jgi:hypothetical protein
MAATRLSDSQKSELVARFRAGTANQELAEAFGCSPNTVSRVVKAALDPAEYVRLKQLRGVSRGHPPAGEEEEHQAKPDPVAASDMPAEAPAGMAAGDLIAPAAVLDVEAGAEAVPDNEYEDIEADEYEELEDDLLDEEEGDDDFLPIPVALAFEDHAPREPLPLAAAPLPASLYMLVDKTVELQARPLCDFPELGRLPQEEQQRQALLVFANPRQAKRQCGRSQRVIKLPDARVLERTASYLLAQGISRVVIEGALYSLPGS